MVEHIEGKGQLRLQHVLNGECRFFFFSFFVGKRGGGFSSIFVYLFLSFFTCFIFASVWVTA